MEDVAEGGGPYSGISESWRAAWLEKDSGGDISDFAPDVCLGEEDGGEYE
jgi:hypothetical protein